MTNMFVWYNSQMNPYGNRKSLLINNSPYETFKKFCITVQHENERGTNEPNVTKGFRDYCMYIGLNVKVYENVKRFSQYKDVLKNGIPILTVLKFRPNNENEDRHSVVTVGYEEFKQEVIDGENYDLRKTEGHKPPTKIITKQYLRVIDGWETSNEKRFVEFVDNSDYKDVFIDEHNDGWGVQII